MQTTLIPYLNFSGNCEEAMNFYKGVMGGELEISRFSNFENSEMPMSDDFKEKVMHAILRNAVLTLMASDVPPMRTVVAGDNVQLSLSGSDEAQLTSFFNGLSEGGVVTMPLAAQVWGDTFGMFKDKYGFNWMVNIVASHPE